MKAWEKYIIEGLVILISVLTAFWLEGWRETNKKRKETINALEMIREDLVTDTTTYGFIKRYTAYYKSIYDKQINPNYKVNDQDSILELYSFSVGYEPISFLSTGFSIFENLEDRLIKNPRVIKSISNYYSDNNLKINYDRMTDLIWDFHLQRSSRFKNSYIQNYFNYDFTSSKSEFLIDKVDIIFNNSNEWIELEYKNFIEEIYSFMQTNDYKNNLFLKQLIEQNLDYYAVQKLGLAKELIKLIDLELKQ